MSLKNGNQYNIDNNKIWKQINDDEIEERYEKKEDQKIFIQIAKNPMEAKKILLPIIYSFYQKIKENKNSINEKKLKKFEKEGIDNADHVLLWNIQFVKWFITTTETIQKTKKNGTILFSKSM